MHTHMYLKRCERSCQQEQRLSRFRPVVQPEQRLHQRRPKPPDRAQVTLVEHVQVHAVEALCRNKPLLHVGVQLRCGALVADNGLLKKHTSQREQTAVEMVSHLLNHDKDARIRELTERHVAQRRRQLARLRRRRSRETFADATTPTQPLARV